MSALSSSAVMEQEFVPEVVLEKKSIPISPARLMLYFWTFIFFIYFFGPIYITPVITLTTFLFLITHIGLFCYGVSLAVKRGLSKKSFPLTAEKKSIQDKNMRNLMLMALYVGLIGCLASIFSKLAAVDVINFAALSKLRSDRALSLMHGTARYSGALSALAFLTYPAGFVGIVAALINYEQISRPIKLLVYLCIASLVLLAVSAGGRSGILVLFILAGAAFYIRKQLGKRFIPKSTLIRVVCIGMLISFFAYSSYIWVVRTHQANLNAHTMMYHSERVWGAHPKEYLKTASEWLGDPQFMQTVLNTTFYFVQSISTTQHVLFANYEVPNLYGTYQMDLAAAFVRAVVGGAEFLQNSHAILSKAHIYGYFTGAWAAFYVDFGVASFLIAVLWGFIAGRAWVNFKQTPGLVTAIPYVFWIYSIFISFVSGPFGFANSFVIFIWFVFLTLGTQLITQLMIARNYELSMANAGKGV